MAHLSCIAGQLSALRAYQEGSGSATIDGHSLDVPAVIAVSRSVFFFGSQYSWLTRVYTRYGNTPLIDSSDDKKARIGAAVAVVQKLALETHSQYGGQPRS